MWLQVRLFCRLPTSCYLIIYFYLFIGLYLCHSGRGATKARANYSGPLTLHLKFHIKHGEHFQLIIKKD